MELVSCVVSNNSADYGGGVFLSGPGSDLTAIDSLIEGNTAAITGGGLYVGGDATLTNTTLSGNTAGWHGGGLHVQDGNAQLTGGVVSGNHATNGNGGGVNLNNGLTFSALSSAIIPPVVRAARLARAAREPSGTPGTQSRSATLCLTGIPHRTMAAAHMSRATYPSITPASSPTASIQEAAVMCTVEACTPVERFGWQQSDLHGQFHDMYRL